MSQSCMIFKDLLTRNPQQLSDLETLGFGNQKFPCILPRGRVPWSSLSNFYLYKKDRQRSTSLRHCNPLILGQLTKLMIIIKRGTNATWCAT